jgi:hypothetical protein
VSKYPVYSQSICRSTPREIRTLICGSMTEDRAGSSSLKVMGESVVVSMVFDTVGGQDASAS